MKNSQPYDAIVVLGAQVRPEGVPSEALRRRLTLALNRYAAFPAPIICCGAQGPGEPMAEGDFMRRWLLDHGVKDADAVSENASTDTMENIWNAKQIMLGLGLSRPLIVTSDYHLPRALAICRRYGLKATGAASPSVPRYWLKNNGRELLAWIKFWLWGLFDRREMK